MIMGRIVCIESLCDGTVRSSPPMTAFNAAKITQKKV